MQSLTMARPMVQSSSTVYSRGRYLPEWLSVEEAADRTGYHPEYLRRLIRARRIKAEKKGLMWWVDPDSLDAYLKEAEEADDARYAPRRGRA